MSKKITDRQYAKALYEISLDLPKSEMEKAVQGFLSMLHKHGRLGRIEKIIGEYLMHFRAEEGIVDIKIESARKLDKKTVGQIKTAFGEKVEAEESIKEELLGGVRVRVGDTVYDSSLQKQLIRLKQALS